MRRIAFILPLAISALLLSACIADSGGGEDVDVGEAEQALSDNACRWHCQNCPPNMFCTQVCERIGNCGDQCDIIAACIEGYAWSADSCSCEPIDTCTYDGQTYNVGDSFPDIDGCNTCSCSEGGLISCTEMACIRK